MTLETLVIETGKSYRMEELVGFANSERLHDIQYFTYISFEPNSIPRKISQHYEVTADVHYQPQTAEESKRSAPLLSSSKPQGNQGQYPKTSCGAGGYDNNGPAERGVVVPTNNTFPSKEPRPSQEGRYFTIVRIYDCTNGPFQSVEKMEFRREGALSLVDRFRQAEGNVVRGYN